MTDTQPWIAIGVPVSAVIMTFLGNMQHARISGLENSISARITALETRVNSGFASLGTRFGTLTGKVLEIDTRLTRVEERLERL